MRFSILLFLFVFTPYTVFSQVSMRDTVISWQHFDYTMDANYSLATYSQTDIVTSTFDGIVLENEYVKLCLIPEFGARIISFVYKPTGKEQLYQNPIGVPYQIDRGIFYHDWLMVYGGIFPTFPEPEHGKYWNVPWNYRVVSSSTEEITISMWLKDDFANPRHPGQYNNSITGITNYFDVTLAAGQANFSVDVRLENDGTSSRYEYWTCLTLAPGSDIGNTFTPSESEMVVPIDAYQVGWNPGNWMNSLDEPTGPSNPRVQVYDKLAHLSEWKNQGIAYAYPDMKEDFYGVINHTNEQGIFRISSDQRKTKGLKFWTWGDEQGLAADPTNFFEEERPYIELWSGVSQEFFEDATLAPNAVLNWTETYFPTVGIPIVRYVNEEAAFGAELETNELRLYGFLPVEGDDTYRLSVTVLNEEGSTVHETDEPLSSNLIDDQVMRLDLSSLGLPAGNLTVQASLAANGNALHTQSFNYQVLSEEPFDPLIKLVNGQLELTFQNETARSIYLYDLVGQRRAAIASQEQVVLLPYPGHGVYILNIIANGVRWSKKIQILE